MSPETLGTALRDLVDDVEDGMAAPLASELWAGGRRRRRTARLVPAVAAACVAAGSGQPVALSMLTEAHSKRMLTGPHHITPLLLCCPALLCSPLLT